VKKYIVCMLILGIAVVIIATEQVFGQEYAGSDVCKLCHASIYDNYMKTGHPYQISKVNGGPPSYPEGLSPGVPNPPSDQTWNDITYVIGGFGWKARYMDSEGYILTGNADRQYNLANGNLGTKPGWSGYDAEKGHRKPYTCGSCHTTGWTTTGESGPHQDDLPGIHGAWAESGIRCEACHGPSAGHVTNPIGVKPTKDESCGDCHARGEVNRIDASGGLIMHHEQYEDLLASPHVMFKCVTCHEPHLSTKYAMGGYKGDDNTCKICHADKEIKMASKTDFDCNTCHMPCVAKSAVSISIETAAGAVPKGDIRAHIFRIKGDAGWNMFTDDGAYVRLDDAGKAHLAMEYTCLTCHTSKNKAWAADNARAIHEGDTSVRFADMLEKTPQDFALYQNYPNPFNPSTTIPFDLKESSVVELKLFNAGGQEITTLMHERLPAGNHKATFAATDLPSGVYYYRITANDFCLLKKVNSTI